MSGKDFLPQRIYGEYLSSLRDETFATGSAATTIRATAIGINRNEASGTWNLALDNGSTVDPHVVVLALGNLPPFSYVRR